MNFLAKTAMVLSLIYYVLLLSYLWVGQITGLHNEVWDFYDFPIQPTSPPLWTLLVGMGVSALALGCLGAAYHAIWRILNGGREQDFRGLARRMKRIGAGLIGCWLGYNLLSGAVQYLIVIGLETTEGFDFEWEPLDLDIVFFIIGIAVLAISQTLERAWLAEEENQQFV